MDTPQAVLAARDLLREVTPLTTDCGALCAGACCRGDEHTGMLLFPGEEALYRGADFCRIRNAAFYLGSGRAKLLVCRGSCPREQRPLACRLFPLLLHVARTGETQLTLDPRAAGLCPLAAGQLSDLDASFLTAARTAYDLLLQDPDCAEYLEMLSLLAED